MSKSKFSLFDISDFTYSTCNNHPLQVSVLRSKNTTHREVSPVLVFWHGGGFIAGDRLYEKWWPNWLIDLAVSQDAIIITPDHRLMPEACGADLVEDICNFWSWVTNELPSIADSWSSGQPDLTNILCCGQSSGGWLAAQSTVLRPDLGIKGAILISGPLFANVPQITVAMPKVIMGVTPPPPREVDAKLRAYVQSIPPGAVRTDGDPSRYWDLVTWVLQRAWVPKLIFKRADPRLDMIQNLRDMERVPPMWIIHGQQDSVTPIACSTEFIKRLKNYHPHSSVMSSLRPGEHNFDVGLGLETPWIREGCNFILKTWSTSGS